jgi:hypothetical protein
LNFNQIGDTGATAIAAALAGSSLTRLDLEGNNISGSQGGVFFGPSGVMVGELVKAWKAKPGRWLLSPPTSTVVAGVLGKATSAAVVEGWLLLSVFGE